MWTIYLNAEELPVFEDISIVQETIADPGLDAELVATHPHMLEDVLDDIERIGQAVDREQKTVELRTSLERRIKAVRERIGDAEDRPSMTVLDWFDPLMISGHWVPELVQIAGGKSRLSNPGERSKPIEWSSLQSADPDIIVTAPCGFALERTSANIDGLYQSRWLGIAQTVKQKQAYAIDGNHYLNRPGPRLVDTLEFLASILHTGYFPDPPADAVSRVDSLLQSAKQADSGS
ncbi:ABC transporter substrate-binding protein (plasmid) [Haladaptatus sp. SPP-AMP-3]|uniref:ABC transporter substrate-binding protein n=1 Tax=Haladaptatus sp. SPP-AMP-3 TaxID=3121295 RepID=UPI003C2F1538